MENNGNLLVAMVYPKIPLESAWINGNYGTFVSGTVNTARARKA